MRKAFILIQLFFSLFSYSQDTIEIKSNWEHFYYVVGVDTTSNNDTIRIKTKTILVNVEKNHIFIKDKKTYYVIPERIRILAIKKQ